MRVDRLLMTAALATLLAGCGETGATTSGSGKAATIRSVGRPATLRPSTARPSTARPQAQILTAPGLEGVIGADADQLVRQFGQPRLDIHEEDARKLQWSGTACILDIYLYPPSAGARPSATYVDARRGDGRDVDRAACIAALRTTPGSGVRRP
ncbi:hypothetical protein [Novosphingobium lentum]|uniref:hypothetical protein n=1 Tax=Novosphingobium lentum TaxID=145287 RepID=UPI00082D6262|nr:hypothetical protein [Novosphingobium lentum]